MTANATDIEGLADIEAQVIIGWIVWRDGLRPVWDTDGPNLFTDYAEAKAARRMLDVVSPVTQERFEELRRRFDPGR